VSDSVLTVSEIVASNRTKTTALLSQSKKQIQTAEGQVRSCREVFDRIVTQVTEVAELSQGISGAIDEQKLGLDEINHAILQFRQGASSNADSAKQTAEVSGNLQRTSQDLLQITSAVEKLVGLSSPEPRGGKVHDLSKIQPQDLSEGIQEPKAA
jgi:methyl-accepting chemotaxis protein